MKKLLLAVSTIVLFASGSAVLADTKIAVLDFNKVLSGSPQIEAAKNELKSKFDVRGKEIESTQKKFQSDVQEFSKNSPTMKADDKKTAEQKLTDQQKKLQEMQTKFQTDLNVAQTEAMQKIMKKVESIVNKTAADKKLDLVLAKSSAAYNKPELDITDEVIKQMKK